MEDTEIKSQRFEMRFSEADAVMLDSLRKAEPDLPTRAEMLRRLIQRAAQKKGRK